MKPRTYSRPLIPCPTCSFTTYRVKDDACHFCFEENRRRKKKESLLKTLAAKPKTEARRSYEWTQEEKSKLLNIMDNGGSADDAAIALGRSYSGCRSMYEKLIVKQIQAQDQKEAEIGIPISEPEQVIAPSPLKYNPNRRFTETETRTDAFKLAEQTVMAGVDYR